MNAGDFQTALEHGKQGELLFSFALQEREFFVTHLAAVQNGGAPRTFGKYGAAIILPDLQAHKNGKTYSIEVKRKAIANPTKINGGRLEHGIGLRKFREYCRYQERTGALFIIGIVEENTGELLARALNNLMNPRIYVGDKMDPGGMAFWARDDFLSFAQISPPKDLPLFRDLVLPPTLPVADERRLFAE